MIKVLKSVALVLPIVLVAGCGSSAPASTLGTISGSRVSVLFQDFQPGTICTAVGPSTSVTQSEMPGKIEFPLELKGVEITCDTPDGSRYAITAHNGYDDATGTIGITVYPDGRSFATYGTKAGLVQAKKTDAVTKIE